MRILNTLSNSELHNALQHQQVAVIPTDTGYEFACAAHSVSAVQRILQPLAPDAPAVVLADSIDQLAALGLKRRYVQSVAHLWPSGISVIIPSTPELTYLDQGTRLLAVRIPDNDTLRELLIQTGPLMTRQPATQAQTVAQVIALTGITVDVCVDVGLLQARPSTLIRIIDDAVEIVRQGSTAIDEATGRILGPKE